MLKSKLPAVLAVVTLAGASAPALGATAHNSQAGAWGPNTHQCAPTPYFQAGGCVSAAVEDDDLYPFEVPPTPYRPGRRLTYPQGLLLDPND